MKITLLFLLLFSIPLSLYSSKETGGDNGEDGQNKDPEVKDNVPGDGGRPDPGSIGCTWCDMFGWGASGNFSFDFDRERIITYLGSNVVVDERKGRAVNDGPFQVMHIGRFGISLGIGGGFTEPMSGSGIKIGLKVQAGRSYRSSTIVNTYSEAKKVPRLGSLGRGFPFKFIEFQKLPNRTTIVTVLNGGIAVYANATAGYVASVGSEIGVTGDWLVALEKHNDYDVTYTIQSVASVNRAIKAGLGIGGGGRTQTNAKSYRHKFDLNLRGKNGIEAYEELMEGRITSFLNIVDGQGKDGINSVLKSIKDDKDISGFFDLKETATSESSSVKKSASINIPLLSFLGNAEKVRGQSDISNEEVLFKGDKFGNVGKFGGTVETLRTINDTPQMDVNDSFATGPVIGRKYINGKGVTDIIAAPGTVLHTVRSTHFTSSQTGGLLSNHKKRMTAFNMKIEEFKVPNFDEKNDIGYIKYNRRFTEISYTRQRQNWDKKDWDYNVKQINKIFPMDYDKQDYLRSIFKEGDKWGNGTIYAKLKISNQAMIALYDLFMSYNSDKELMDALRKIAQQTAFSYARNTKCKEYLNEEHKIMHNCINNYLTKVDNKFQSKFFNLVKGKYKSVLSNFIEKLKGGDKNLENRFREEVKEGDQNPKFTPIPTLQESAEQWAELGKIIIDSPFLTRLIRDMTIQIQSMNPKNDVTLCVGWSSDRVKRGVLVLDPTARRPDGSLSSQPHRYDKVAVRNDGSKCALMEDIDVDPYSEKLDKEVFGDEFDIDKI